MGCIHQSTLVTIGPIRIYTFRAPFKDTRRPGQNCLKTIHKIIYDDWHNGKIVSSNCRAWVHLRPSNSSQSWDNCPNLHCRFARELPHYHFQIVKRFSDQKKHYQVRNQKSSTAVFESSEWKPEWMGKNCFVWILWRVLVLSKKANVWAKFLRLPPNITQPYGHGYARHQKFHSFVPCLSVFFGCRSCLESAWRFLIGIDILYGNTYLVFSRFSNIGNFGKTAITVEIVVGVLGKYLNCTFFSSFHKGCVFLKKYTIAFFNKMKFKKFLEKLILSYKKFSKK